MKGCNMAQKYYVMVFPHFGGERHYETERDINLVIQEHEVMGDYLLIEDERGVEIYRTWGLDSFLGK